MLLPHLLHWLREQKLQLKSLYNYWFLFRWDHIKWYNTFEEVAAIQDFIEWCQCEQVEVDGKEVNADEYYRFVRIGEEMDDNEVEGWGFDIHIERSATY